MNLKRSNNFDLLRCVILIVILCVFNKYPKMVFAATTSATDAQIQKLLSDPNANIIVHDSTFSGTPNPTLAVQATTQAPRSIITIDYPSEGAVLVESNLIFSGKAPANTLVSVDITDDDFTNASIEHQTLLHTLGTTTSDGSGKWVFSSQSKLELGKYTVSVSFSDPQYGKIEAGPVRFIVTDVMGKSQNVIFWRSPQFWLFLILIICVLGGVGFLIFRRGLINKVTMAFPTAQSIYKLEEENRERLTKDIPFIKLETKVDEVITHISDFITPQEASEQLEVSKKEEKGRIIELRGQLASLKDTLMILEKNIASAGHATEDMEKELQNEMLKDTSQPDNETKSKLKIIKRHREVHHRQTSS
jgi:hypothetical protein